MDLIRQLSCEFAITTHVSEEISNHYREQKQRLSEAINNGTLSEFAVDKPNELSLFTAFAASGRLGSGECSAIAAAIVVAMTQRLVTRERVGTRWLFNQS